MPDLTHAIGIELSEGTLRATCKLEGGSVIYEADLPVLVTFDQEVNTPRLPSMVGVMKAAASRIETWRAADLGLKTEKVGLKGSPTQMLNVFTAPMGRKGDILQGTPDELAAKLIEKLRSERILS
jgi:electron transfer flavoprotein beta subunit